MIKETMTCELLGLSIGTIFHQASRVKYTTQSHASQGKPRSKRGHSGQSGEENMELQCCFGNLGLDPSSKVVPSNIHDEKSRVTKSGNLHMFHIK